MGFPRQEYWSGLPFPSPGDLPDPGIEPASPASAGRFFAIVPGTDLHLKAQHCQMESLLWEGQVLKINAPKQDVGIVNETVTVQPRTETTFEFITGSLSLWGPLGKDNCRDEWDSWGEKHQTFCYPGFLTDTSFTWCGHYPLRLGRKEPEVHFFLCRSQLQHLATRSAQKWKRSWWKTGRKPYYFKQR